MVFDANIDAKGDRTDHSSHHTKVSLLSIHNKSILGTLGIVVVILGQAIAVWIFHRKRITKHRRRHAALLALTYSPGEQTLRNAEGGEVNYKQQQLLQGQGSSILGSTLTQ
jgi:flagellar biosynthesis/type III secretory pathway M-ring protein FliF/YscJ